MNLTIENRLESAIHNIQNNWSDDTRFREAQDKLFYLCCGIVAGLNANKQEASTTNDEETTDARM